MRVSLVVVVSVLAGSIAGAAAQTYPLPPGEYYPAPPQPYDEPPVPPGGVGAPVPQPAYDMPYSDRSYADPPNNDPSYEVRAGAEPADAYPPPPPAQPYFTPANHAEPPAMPSLGWDPAPRPPGTISAGAAPADVTGSIRGPAPNNGTVIAALPPEDQPETGPAKELPLQFRRQLVDYVTTEPAGTVIIDTAHTYLYLVRGGGKAVRYGIGVGREGFTWSGGERISRMSEWPDWHPPKEMIERQPYLPRFMAGGEGNPLGARALYLGNTLYRIHGTNQPSTIGSFVSSGCIRLTNDDVADLYSRVNLGTRVVVLPGGSPASASAAATPIAR